MNNKKKFKVKITDDKQKKSNSFKRTFMVFLSALLCTILLAGCGLVAVDYVINGDILGDETEDDTPEDSNVATPEKVKEKQMNILLCGIDSGTNRRTSLTDVIMVANIDFVNEKINILQIPRDTYIGYDAVYTGKINGVYPAGKKGKGINGLKNAISSQFKINIDYYVTMNLDGFRDITKAVGGVPITLEEDFYFQEDGYQDINLKAGYHVLQGREAEAFVRERNNRGGDIGRVQQGQRVFMAAFIDKMMSLNKTELITKTAPEIFKYVKTDFSLSEVGKYADAILKMDTSNITFDIVPGEGFYDKSTGQSLYAVHLDPFVEIINTKFRQHLEDPITKKDLGINELVNNSDKYDNTEENVGNIVG